MAQILRIREIIVTFIKRYETVFRIVVKLLVALFLFNFINKIGGYDERFEPLFKGSMSVPYFLLISLLFAIFPPTLGNLLVSAEIVIQISSSPITALVVGLVLTLVLLFYSRMDPQKSYLIIAMVLGFYFNMPYAVVIFAGLYMGLTSIIPISIGTFLWNLIPLSQHLFETANLPPEVDLMSIPTTFIDVYQSLFNSLTTDFEWVFFCFIFAMAIICVHFVSRLSINYSKEIAILLGGLVAIFSMAVASAVIGISVSVLGAVFYVILSVLIVEAASFFDLALDYNKAERIQFEDDEYYYFVKAIPKIIINTELLETVEKPEPSKKRFTSGAKIPAVYDDDFPPEGPVDFSLKDRRETADIPIPHRKVIQRPVENPVERPRAADRPENRVRPEPVTEGLGKVKKRMTPEEYERFKARMDALNRPMPPVYKNNSGEQRPE